MKRLLKKFNVIFSQSENRKKVIRDEREIADDETFISEKPHENGDMSYQCGSDYCRCAQ
jgi:hypothetical protein